MGGPTGLILCPSPGLLASNSYGAVHRGSMKFSLGLADFAETGVKLPDLFDRPGRDDWKTLTRGHAKVALPSPGGPWSWIPASGVGAENSPDQTDETYYATGIWRATVSQWPLELLLGYGTGRFDRNPFYGITLMPYTYLGHSIKFMAEYGGHNADAGVRFALSKTLRLDFAMIMDTERIEADGARKYSFRINRAILGASQTGQIRPERILEILGRKRAPKPQASVVPE